MPSPTFGFKTYEGDWFCIDIEYNEDSQFIQQRFKIDAQIGDLGDPDVTPVSTQVGDDVRISSGMTLERSYYWRIVNPERVSLPAAVVGEIWTKTSNDNGDGTYDVIISKETEVDLTADSEVQAGPSGTGGYFETTTVSTNSEELEFGINPEDIPDAIAGQIIRIDNVPLENGKFRSTVTTRTAISQRIPPTEGTFISWHSDFQPGGGKLIKGINRPYEGVGSFTADLLLIDVWAAIAVVTVSINVNDYGLYDYSMRASS
jgi:hypothetical protein